MNKKLVTVIVIMTASSSPSYAEASASRTEYNQTAFYCPPPDEVSFDDKSYVQKDRLWRIPLTQGMPSDWENLTVRIKEDNYRGAGDLEDYEIPQLEASRLEKVTMSDSGAFSIQCIYVENYPDGDNHELIVTPSDRTVPGSINLHYPVKAVTGKWRPHPYRYNAATDQYSHDKYSKACSSEQCGFAVSRLSIHASFSTADSTEAMSLPAVKLSELRDQDNNIFDFKAPVRNGSLYSFVEADNVTARTTTELLIVQPDGTEHKLDQADLSFSPWQCDRSKTTICNTDNTKPQQAQCTQENIQGSINLGNIVIIDISGEYEEVTGIKRLDCTVFSLPGV